jgi:flagellar biosynthesis protein FlhF
LRYVGYIFTKLDETRDGAALVNLLLSQPRPLSYLTTGQRVPEDIEPASKKRLAALLLRRQRGPALTGGNGAQGREAER